jgi:ribonuclease HII
MNKPANIDWISEMGLSGADREVLLAGVDEAGRGPLAGPVVAAAVILDPQHPISGLADSKTLRPKMREQLAAQIYRYALAWGVGEADIDEIDQVNILQATMLAMQRAVAALRLAPQHVLIDGNRCPPLEYNATAIVRGDEKVAQISAASVLAKVARDRMMQELDRRYPAYGFAKHKGYPTRAHLDALRAYGPCPCHRRSFAPVRALLRSHDEPSLSYTP